MRRLCPHVLFLAAWCFLLCPCQGGEAGSNSSAQQGVSKEGKSKAFQQAYEKGRRDAERDVASGVLAIEIYGEGYSGKQTPVNPKVEMRRVAGCIVNDQILGHAKGYNEVSDKAIKKRSHPGS